jgi:hypothetical protein
MPRSRIPGPETLPPATFSPSSRYTKLRPFLDHGTLELRETSQHVHHQLPSSRLRLDALGDALKAGAYTLDRVSR